MENYEKAEPLLIETLVIQKNKLSEADPALLGSQIHLAHNYYERARYEKAETLYLESLAIMEKISDTIVKRLDDDIKQLVEKKMQMFK